jgi:lipid A 3-O-deacylase
MRPLFFIALLPLLYSSPLWATDATRTEEDDKDIFNLIFENDVFAGTDHGYTNGVRAAWLSSETNTPDWAKWTANNLLPLSKDGNKRISLAVGQSMFAPDNLAATTPVPGDRPYAGWLYGSVGMVSDTGKTLDNAVLTVGVVGPQSYAEQTQKIVHAAIGSPRPNGWNYQLKTEPGVNLAYERKWRGLYEASPFGVGVDVMPHVAATLGNVDTNASVGATFRLGYDLPADYGPPRIRPSLPGSDFFIPTKEFGGYLFTTVEERAVGRNIFLDGNTFEDSVHVNKEIFVSSLQLGAAVTYGAARLSYTHVLMTREFTTEKGHPQFGALTFSCRF